MCVCVWTCVCIVSGRDHHQHSWPIPDESSSFGADWEPGDLVIIIIIIGSIIIAVATPPCVSPIGDQVVRAQNQGVALDAAPSFLGVPIDSPRVCAMVTTTMTARFHLFLVICVICTSFVYML